MLLINKPPGITSHDVVDEVRKATGIKKVGHAGTLDPFAEGLLIILVGREETRLQSKFLNLDKEYEATLILGAETDTFDSEGKIQDTNKLQIPKKKTVEAALKKFIGEQEQMPPAFSAKKVKGKKAYELARKGETVELEPKKVTIHNLELLDYDYPELKIRTRVSSGTYIRALARDIGRALGTGAHVKELKRTQIGEHKLKDAQTLKELREESAEHLLDKGSPNKNPSE